LCLREIMCDSSRLTLASAMKYCQEDEGEMVTTSGEVVGRHRGVHHLHIGQRKGLGIAAGRPLYVVELDRATNRVVVGDDAELRVQCMRRAQHQLDFRSSSRISVSGGREDSSSAMIRRSQQSCRVGERAAQVQFDEPQRAITPGQAAVFYMQDVVPAEDGSVGAAHQINKSKNARKNCLDKHSLVLVEASEREPFELLCRLERKNSTPVECLGLPRWLA